MQNLIVFICILVMAIFPASYLLIESAKIDVETVIFVVSAILLTLMVLIGAVFFLAGPIIRMVLRDTTAKLDTVLTEASAALSAFQRSEKEEAIQHCTKSLREVAAWYSAGALRRWAFGAVAAVGVVFTGAIGSILLVQQNGLLREQNTKIDTQVALMKSQNEKMDIQSALADGQRRTALIAELSSILSTINVERENWNQISAPQKLKLYKDLNLTCPQKQYENGSDIPLILSDLTTARIAALTRSTTPYYMIKYINNEPTIDRRLRSPERGQILITLSASDIILEPILQKATFAFADLRNTFISSANLCKINASFADFSGSRLYDVSLLESNLYKSVFNLAILVQTDLNFGSILEAQWMDSRIEGGAICTHEKSEPRAITGAYLIDIQPCVYSISTNKNINDSYELNPESEKIKQWENTMSLSFPKFSLQTKGRYGNMILNKD